MPAPLDIDREQVRLLVQQHGVREAARMCGLAEPTVQAWSARYGWIRELTDRPHLPPTLIQRASTATIRPADANAELIRKGSRGWKVASAKVGAKLAEKEADELMEPGVAQKWAGVAQKAGLLTGGVEGVVRLEVLARSRGLEYGQDVVQEAELVEDSRESADSIESSGIHGESGINSGQPEA